MKTAVERKGIGLVVPYASRAGFYNISCYRNLWRRGSPLYPLCLRFVSI